VVQPAVEILGLATSISATAGNDAFLVRLGVPNTPVTPTFMSDEQAIRAGGTAVTATLASDQPTFGQLVTSAQTGGTVTVGIAVGQSRSPNTVANGGVEFDPLAAGTTRVSVTVPGFIITLPNALVTVTVTP